MRRNVIVAFIVALSSILTPGATWSAVCTIDDSGKELEAKMNGIQEAYGKKFEARRKEVERESEGIKRDAPNTNNPTTAIGFDFDVKWKTQEVKLHVPEFRLEDRKIAFNLPRLELKQQIWIYHTPSVKMEQRCVRRPDETVCEMKTKCIGGGATKICTDIPECRTRGGGQMCTEVPVPFNQEQRTTLGVPEITGSERHEVVLGVPVIEMRLQTWKFDLPEFTLKDVKVETAKLQSRAKDLQEREKNATQLLSDSMKGEIKKATADDLEQTFKCQEVELTSQREKAVKEIDANLQTIAASIKNAQSFGAKNMEESMKRAHADLTLAREQTIATINAALDQLAQQKRTAIDKVLKN